MLSKKYYKVLAEAIRESRLDQDKDCNLVNLSGLMVRLCNALKRDNSSFDADKFYDAVYKK